MVLQPFATAITSHASPTDNPFEPQKSMTNEHRPAPTIIVQPALGPSTLEIETFSYEERRVIFPALAEALDHCGCWLLDRRPLSFTQMEFYFEAPLRSVLDLYAAFIAAGLELTRTSHEDLTRLCILRKHQEHPDSFPGVITVRLEIAFLEDLKSSPSISPGTPLA
jgi:hypothetical protein